MTKLAKEHPFILTIQKLEILEVSYGLTDEIIQERIRLKKAYPEYFAEYMKAKGIKQEEKLHREKIEKEIQMRERRGFETVSYLKNKIEKRKLKNRDENKNNI